MTPRESKPIRYFVAQCSAQTFPQQRAHTKAPIWIAESVSIAPNQRVSL
jgi:hypothetical protein